MGATIIEYKVSDWVVFTGYLAGILLAANVCGVRL